MSNLQTGIIKYINIYTLGSINAVIVILTELSGETFYQTGIIHIIAVLFVFINIFLFKRFLVLSNPSFKKIFKYFIIATIFASLIHIFEYAGNNSFLQLPNIIEEAIDIVVVLGYIFFFLVVFGGMRSVLAYLNKISGEVSVFKILSRSVLFYISVISALVLVLVFREKTDYLIFFTISGLILILNSAAIIVANKLAELLSILKSFLSYYQVSFVLIFIATIFEISETIPSLESYAVQITYLSHFFYYSALSAMILGVVNLFKLGGIYQNLLRKAGVIV